MTSRAPERSGKSSPSAIVLVECLVKVSPSLARLIRKSAEKEAGGVSATNALLAAAGVEAHELASLRRAVEQLSAEARQISEQAADERVSYDQANTTIAQRDREIAALRSDVRKATAAVEDAQKQILDLTAQSVEMATSLESRDAQLTRSIPLSGLDDGAAAALRALRNRLASGEFQHPSNTVAALEPMIENLNRPEMLALSKMLSRGARRVPLVRWLLRDRMSLL